MHATIQKPSSEILSFLDPDEKVFVIGCGNCAMKCHSGGPSETEAMARRLSGKGVNVLGHTVPGPQGMSLCKLSNTKKHLAENFGALLPKVDSFLVLACGQGIHTVIDATQGGHIHPGCDTLFGGETVTDTEISEFCSLCGQCVVETTGGLCPLTLCSKQLLNGPCGGAEKGKCEVDQERECGWVMIYERLARLGRLEKLNHYQEPKNHARWSRPRSVSVSPEKATFYCQEGPITVSSQD
jgi:hypothetical protein